MARIELHRPDPTGQRGWIVARKQRQAKGQLRSQRSFAAWDQGGHDLERGPAPVRERRSLFARMTLFNVELKTA